MGDRGKPDSEVYLDDPGDQVIQDGLDGLGRVVRVGLASALPFRSSVLYVYIDDDEENESRRDSLILVCILGAIVKISHARIYISICVMILNIRYRV